MVRLPEMGQKRESFYQAAALLPGILEIECHQRFPGIYAPISRQRTAKIA